MDFKEQFFKLRDEFIATDDPARKAEIDAEITKLMLDNPDEAPSVYRASLTDTIQRIDSHLVRQQLEPVLAFIPTKYLAKHYLGKSNAWFSQRLNGHVVGGRRMGFKPEELDKIEEALHDMGAILSAFKFSI